MEKQKKGFFYYYDKVEDAFLLIGFVVITALAFAQIVLRTIFSMSYPWLEEIIRYIYIWLCWVGVSLAERRGEHIRLDFLIAPLPKKVKEIIDMLVSVLMVALAAWLVYQGVMLTADIYAAGQVSAGAKLPMYFVYASLPVGCFLYGVRMIVKLTNQIKNFKRS